MNLITKNLRSSPVFMLIFFLANFTQVFSQIENDSSKRKIDFPDSLKVPELNKPSLKIPDSIPITYKVDLPAKPKTNINYKPNIGRPKLKTSGQITLDNHFAQVQNPFVRSDLIYSRLSHQGNFSIGGLPFRSTAFITSEKGAMYQPNFVNVQFDAQTLNNNIKDGLNSQLKSAEKSLTFSGALFTQTSNLLKTQDQIIEGLNNKIADLKKHKDLPQARLPNEKDLKDSLNRRIPNKPTPSDSLLKGNDTLYHKLISKRDSLTNKRDSVYKLFDSAYTKYKNDSIKVAELRKLLESDPNELLRDSLSRRCNKYIGWISSIKNFQIGQPILNYNQLSLWGTSIIGLDIQTEQNKWIVGLGMGRAINQLAMYNTEDRLRYNRNIGAVQLGRVIGEGDKIAFQYFYAFDSKKEQSPVKNQVMTLEIIKSYKSFKLSLSAGQSDYQSLSPIIESQSQPSVQNNPDNKALLSNLKYETPFGSTFSFGWNYIGARYITIGNPFLRRNYTEKDIAWEQKWAKNKLKSKVFYKELVTLENEMSPEQNQTKGAGIQLNSNFSKGANFFIVYSPYEMGNNHPDTAFRTFNRTGFASAGVNYYKIRKQTIWYIQSSYSSSSITFDEQEPIRNNQFMIESSMSFFNKHEIKGLFNHNRTSPNLDTMNFNSVVFQYNQLVKQNLKMGALVKANSFSESANIIGAGISISTKLLRHIQCSGIFELDRIQNWWGVEGTKLAVTSNLRLQYVW